MARALYQLELEEVAAARQTAATAAKTPPKWRAIKARVNRAAAILGAKGWR